MEVVSYSDDASVDCAAILNDKCVLKGSILNLLSSLPFGELVSNLTSFWPFVYVLTFFTKKGAHVVISCVLLTSDAYVVTFYNF